MVTRDDEVFHICLAGARVSNDWSLIQTLKSQHLVTLIERIHLLSRSSIPAVADIVVLDCSGNHEQGMQLVPWLKSNFPKLVVVLVNGGLSQEQIASAFRDGVKDYFADPYDVKLLAERVHTLGARKNRDN